ncbi:MAG: ABC transporter substrate-binding protein [bacterium]
MRARVLLLSALLCLPTGCRDRTRGKAPRAGKPRRVASTMVAADEILLTLIGPQRLVAVTRFSVRPSWSVAAAQARAVKGRIHTVGGEAVLRHRPDLCVLADYAHAETALVLRRAGVRIVRLPSARSLATIRRTIRVLGDAVGEPQRAHRILAWLDATVATYRKAVEPLSKRPEVMSATNGFLAGTNTIFDDIVRLAGGQNVARRLGITGHSRVDTEAIWRADPSFVLVQAPDQKGALAAARADPVLSKLAAVTAGRVLYLPRALLTCASHHIVRSIWVLLRQLHPQLSRSLKPPPPLGPLR